MNVALSTVEYQLRKKNSMWKNLFMKIRFLFLLFSHTRKFRSQHSCSLHSHFHFPSPSRYLIEAFSWRHDWREKILPNISFYVKELRVDIVVIKKVKKLSILVVPWIFVCLLLVGNATEDIKVSKVSCSSSVTIDLDCSTKRKNLFQSTSSMNESVFAGKTADLRENFRSSLSRFSLASFFIYKQKKL